MMLSAAGARLINRAAIDAMTADRSPKDYAIEFGEYLAQAAEQFQDMMQDVLKGDYDQDAMSDAWQKLDSAIYEFRKRKVRAEHGHG